MINYSLLNGIQCTRCKNAFNKRFQRIVSQNNFAESYSEKIITVCNAVYFRLYIDLMHILPPVTAEGFDGSHHRRFAECIKEVAIRTTFRHMINIAGISNYTCCLVIDIQCTRYKNAFIKRL